MRSGVRQSRGRLRLWPNMLFAVSGRSEWWPCSPFQKRSPSTLPQIARACFGASRQSAGKSVTPAAASRACMPFEMPGSAARSSPASRSGRSVLRITAMPSGLCISAPILASNSVDAMPIEQVRTGLKASASAALMRSASTAPCRASSGRRAQTISSIDRTSATGRMVSTTTRMRLWRRT